MKRVLIIGGYGNFGSYIARSLAGHPNIQLVIAGRSEERARTFCESLETAHKAEGVSLDISQAFEMRLRDLAPDIVIHTSGPFQSQGYEVAQACIAAQAHYIDLADGREFVAGIGSLDPTAKKADVLVISGASSVPCLTSALLDNYRNRFASLESVHYGITTAQKTNRGLATTAAILGYTGKAFSTRINGQEQRVYGWQDLHSREFASLGKRYLGNCDIPDLALFPARYPDLKTIRFYAGLEIPFLHWTLFGISWLVRIGVIPRLEKAAGLMLKLSYLFDPFGSANSGFFMELTGKTAEGQTGTIRFDLTARSGDGPFIPCMPAILLARKLAQEKLDDRGAFPCMGFIRLEDYLEALKPLDITWTETAS